MLEARGRSLAMKNPSFLRRTIHVAAALVAGELCVCVISTGCRPPSPAPPVGKITVFVSILPQSYFVQRVGGEHVDVHVLVGPGQSHHSYEPTPRQVSDLAKARVYFRIGVPFEAALLGKISAAFKGLDLVDTSQGIRFRQSSDSCTESGHEHAHAGGKDPHIWLDPQLVKIQAQTICDALCRIDPDHRADYEGNLRAFQADLDAVDVRIAKALAPLKGREFFVFHPAYGYFGDAYGLRQVAVEDEGKEPSLKRLAELIERARRAGARLILVQPQFPTSGAKAVADAIGGAVVPIDPLAADYLKNLEYMADQIAAALGPQGVAIKNGH